MRTLAAGLAFCAALAAADPNWIEAAGGVATRDTAGRIVGVDLRSSWVTDSDLAELAQLPHLARLDLSHTRITDRGMQQLKNAPAIVDLNLYYAEQITDEGMAAIKGWKRLKHLNVRGTKITDTTLEHVAGIATLESLDAGYAQVTDVGLQALRYLTGLTHLDLTGMQRTDSGLWSISLTEFGVDTIATLKELRELRLGGMPVSARSLEKLKVLSKLERLVLQGCKRVGDDAAPVLASWPSLTIVDLKGTAMTEKGLAELRQAKPNARILHGPWEGPKMPVRGE